MKSSLQKMTLSFLALVLFTTAFSQQTTRNLSLNEAIDLTVKNSNLLKQNQARILEATAAVTEAEDRRLPDFNISNLHAPEQSHSGSENEAL